MIYTKHIAGQYYKGLQRCIICGIAIIDDRGAVSPEGSPSSKGWDEGAVFMSDGNPRITMKADPSPEYEVIYCQ
jgi:hypothetical protein